MASTDTSGRQLLGARLRSAIATAAVVGAVGGWVAFGMQPSATASGAVPAPQVDDSSVGAGNAQGQAQPQLAGPSGFNGNGSATAPSDSTMPSGSATAPNGSTTAPSQSTVPSRGRRGPATSTHSSR